MSVHTGPVEKRWPTTLDFRRYLSPGDTVAWSHAGGEPQGLVAQLLEQRHALGGRIGVFLTGVSFSEILQPEHADVIQFTSIGGIGTHQRLARAGCLEVLPCRYSDLPGLIASNRVRVDVALFSGSLPDADGRISLGPTMGVARDILDTARVAILEINPNVPYVLGDTAVDPSEFDAVTWSELPLVSAPASTGALAAETEQVCRNVAAFVPDRSTLQLGFGSVGRALPRFLGSHVDLGIHSAILTDEIADLIDAGIANGAAKEVDAGLAVAGELLGTERLYRFADRNPAMALRGSSYLLADDVLSRFETLISVNSALEVDLTGQVNAESRHGIHVGAVGGQVDFVRAAARSRKGASIIALPSTTTKHHSRIVPALDRGVVTTARSEVEIVVTEYGAADLRGRSLRDRAQALIEIAHPDHRAELSGFEVVS
jgi:acetyl-CoA hydrolase